MAIVDIRAEIAGLKYKPLLCGELLNFPIARLEYALSNHASFILGMNHDRRFAVSWWVSPKRTRSYPYARVYDTLSFNGKRATIIPVIKDEGFDGDRDFLQWDTVSLMSLLGVYVILSNYITAERNPEYESKITNQRYDVPHIIRELEKLSSYHTDALHWNMGQIDNINWIVHKAFDDYDLIAQRLGIQMHSRDSAIRRIEQIGEGKEAFMNLSRDLAKDAQSRESKTLQPKEKLSGTKGKITIKNFLGGFYYFTCDEVKIEGDSIYLTEAKHTKTCALPSEGDIKDGLIKMFLFSNLVNVRIGDKTYKPIPVLKLTTGGGFALKFLQGSQKRLFEKLCEESKTNSFLLKVNKRFI